jgi:hypothetical protein
MANFEVYPHAPNNPPTDPLTVAAGATETITITQREGQSTLPDFYVKMMFIRVAVFGTPPATAPEISLQAGTGTPVVAVISPPRSVFNDLPPTNYVGDVQLIGAQQANVQLVRFGFQNNTTETWQLKIKNKDANDRQFTVVVAGTEDETAQPWGALSVPSLALTSLVNRPGETSLRIEKTVQVANYGTASLNVQPFNPPLAAPFELVTALPFTVDPGKSSDLTLRYTPPDTPHSDTTQVKLVANPADPNPGTTGGHNAVLDLTATAQQLEVVLLLDDSGSMGTDKLGGTPSSKADSRWGQLVSAANPFLDLLAFFGAKRGKFGIARFPAPDPTNPSTYDVVPMTDITTDMHTAQTNVSVIVPFNGTPMGDGLFRVLGPTSYFSATKTNRRWLIMMTDGAHNSGTHNPIEFIDAAHGGTALAGKSLDDLDITLFGIAYGIPGFTDVNHTLVKQLTSGSQGGGQFRAVQVEGTMASDLSTQMRDTLKSGLTAATSPLDPTGVFVIGTDEVCHDVTLTPYDQRAAFVLNWNTPDANRLRLELLTPNGDRITPDNADQFAGVSFKGGDRSAMYLVDTEFFTGGERGPSFNGGHGRAPGAGTWTLVITHPDVIIITLEAAREEQDTEAYAYDTIVESRLKVEVANDRDTYYAGDPIGVSAEITLDGRPVRNAAVSMSLTKPAESFNNWLAAVHVPDAALRQAQEQLKGKDASPILVKQLGAQIAGLVFDGEAHTRTIPMTDHDGDGVYRATFAETTVPEHYTFYVTAIGVTEDDVTFRREGKQETFVLVKPDPTFTDVQFQQVAPGQVVVTAIPKDQFGNVLLIDPATAGGFGVVAPDTTVGPLVSGLDGTYTSTVTFDPKQTPELGVQIGGVDVTVPTRIVPLTELSYPDVVVQYVPGAIVDTNKHRHPEAALGEVAGRKPDQFVALGAGGSIVLAKRFQLILAKAHEDVTVFTTGADRRSYRVEAWSLRDGNWVELGTSGGITKSFGLADAGLKFTPAIRITDTSGRVRADDLTPLDAPGLNLLGMGVLRTSRDIPRGQWCWPYWWDRSGHRRH